MNQLLFFAGLRDLVGDEQIDMDLAGKSIKEIREILIQKYALDRINEAMVAINEEFAMNDSVIKDGDVIAFLPPVSGG